MPAPRGVEQRLRWMLNNPPNKVGMCARTCWQALGGDYGNPPAWGAPDANSVYQKVIASGRYWKGDPPRGALIIWQYGQHGHTALSYGSGKIVTTDPDGRPGKTGIEHITYPHRWGASATRRIWTDQYAGTRFPVGNEEEDDMALSDEDIDKIARKVWKYVDEHAEKNMQFMLRSVWRATVPVSAANEDEQ